ncbi:MAG: hypothetical protein BM485_01190 [Desulfobulbaceae bacterium DB1]|nr:MAG: hypothetical protein BM485_01190 [Desulfobulbaceae bacterium DB1]
MLGRITKSVVVSLLLWVAFCLQASMSWSALALQSEIVSGNIVEKYEDHSLKLDNGVIYKPSREGLNVDVQIGEPVTLRYIAEDSDNNVFFEFAPGMNSLVKLPPPTLREVGVSK